MVLIPWGCHLRHGAHHRNGADADAQPDLLARSMNSCSAVVTNPSSRTTRRRWSPRSRRRPPSSRLEDQRSFVRAPTIESTVPRLLDGRRDGSRGAVRCHADADDGAELLDVVVTRGDRRRRGSVAVSSARTRGRFSDRLEDDRHGPFPRGETIVSGSARHRRCAQHEETGRLRFFATRSWIRCSRRFSRSLSFEDGKRSLLHVRRETGRTDGNAKRSCGWIPTLNRGESTLHPTGIKRKSARTSARAGRSPLLRATSTVPDRPRQATARRRTGAAVPSHGGELVPFVPPSVRHRRAPRTPPAAAPPPRAAPRIHQHVDAPKRLALFEVSLHQPFPRIPLGTGDFREAVPGKVREGESSLHLEECDAARPPVCVADAGKAE